MNVFDVDKRAIYVLIFANVFSMRVWCFVSCKSGMKSTLFVHIRHSILSDVVDVAEPECSFGT